MHIKSKRTAIAAAGVATAALMTGAGLVGAANADQSTDSARATESVSGKLNALNNSGVSGKATVDVDGRQLTIDLEANRLAKKLPHAQHIHFGAKAANECPNIGADDNGDFRLTTVEGLPAYGPVKVSLTTKGDTSAKSILAVTRFPTANRGEIDYSRTTNTTKFVARGIARGEAVVVIHGVDYNANGAYDFKSAGKSELDPSLPAEATDPAACGVLRK